MNSIAHKILRRVAYRKETLALARVLGLRKVLRRWYFNLVCPESGILDIDCGELKSSFQVHTPEEFRILESLGGGERPVLEQVISELPLGAVVYDIGANVGLYTVFMAMAVGDRGRVVAFEPHPQSYSHLLANITLNRLANVRCIQKALGKQAGKGRLFQGDIIGNYSLVSSNDQENSFEIVDVVAGDEFAYTNNLPPPHLVKIDVEGFEYEVVRGLHRILRDDTCRIVCIEIHPYLLPEGLKAETVLDALKTAGFDRQEIYKRPDDFHAIMWKSGGGIG